MKNSKIPNPNKIESSNELSQYLHDVLAGDLLHLQFMFHKIESEVNKESFIELNEELSFIRNKVRNLSHQLLTINENHETIEELTQHTLIDFTYVLPDIHFSLYTYPKNAKTQLSNVVLSEFKYVLKELINNAITHGKSDHIETNIIVHSEVLSIVISDDGLGFDVHLQKNKGIGLLNIKKRIEKVGGSLLIDSSIGRGTTISIEIPRV